MLRTLYLFVLFSVISRINANELIVNTTNGEILGHLVNNDQVIEFTGIPFAAPPVNDLRFEPPQPIDSWSNVYVADYIHPGCPQKCFSSPGNCPDTTSEDCLYLNIWTPTDISEGELLPVFLWFHGGSFVQGASNIPLYNGSHLVVNERIIVVTVNYRLGVLGFLASETLSGNFGLLDQRLGMKWVKTNIHNFGGNANNITLAGQSAGAMSVLWHLLSEGSQNLFQKSVMESNPLAVPYHSRLYATKYTFYVGKYLNCSMNDIDCLKSASVDDLLDAQDFSAQHFSFRTIFDNFISFSPVVDEIIIGDGTDNSSGWNILTSQPFDMLRNGNFPKDQLIQAGTVSEEGRMFVYDMFPSPVSSAMYITTISLIFGFDDILSVIEMYPPNLFNNLTDTRDVISQMATDLLFFCPLRNASKEILSQFSMDIYLYYFSHIMSFDTWGPDETYCAGHVCHNSELRFVFDVFSYDNVSYNITDDEQVLSNNLMTYWGNFIKTGNPNTNEQKSELLQWPLYSFDDSLIELQQPLSQITDFRSDYCDFWDIYGYYY